MKLEEIKTNDLCRCRTCGALWWLTTTSVGNMWTLRTPIPCGQCCDNSTDFLSKLDLVCHEYEGFIFRPADDPKEGHWVYP